MSNKRMLTVSVTGLQRCFHERLGVVSRGFSEDCTNGRAEESRDREIARSVQHGGPGRRTKDQEAFQPQLEAYVRAVSSRKAYPNNGGRAESVFQHRSKLANAIPHIEIAAGGSVLRDL